MLRLLIVLLLTQAALLAKDVWDDGRLLPPPPIFTPSIIPKVDVVSGEYCEQEIDFLLAGCEPLTIRRFYSHKGHKNPAYGHWKINPESLMLFNFYRDNPNSFAGFGCASGGFIVCEERVGEQFFFDIKKHKSYVNASYSGKNHPLNASCSIQKIVPG